MEGRPPVKAVIVLLALLAPAAAAAQGRAAAGEGGVLPDLSAVNREVGRVMEGPVGRAGEGLVGVAGLAASIRYGALAAFGALSGSSDPLVQVGVAADGAVSGEPATDTTTATATSTGATAPTSTQ
jgi:hypothetical protein